MTTFSKFNIGQQVRHKLLGFLGVIIDIDPEYSLLESDITEELLKNKTFKKSPWYHVIMEDNNGYPIHTYLAEAQLSWENQKEHPEQPSLDELSNKIKKQFKKPKLRN